MSTSRRKVVGSSHLVPQTKESLLKMAVSGPPSEKRSDHHTPDFLVENPRTCDICRRSETIWNLIVVCSSCKVKDISCDLFLMFDQGMIISFRDHFYALYGI
jgi:hypothetical protein